MKKIIFSEESQSNLMAIFDYIKTHFNLKLATSTVNEILERIDSLKKFPQLGKASEYSALVRELIVKDNIVFYQINDNSIEIIYIKIKKAKDKKF